MSADLAKYAAKLAAAGLCAPGEALFAALDDTLTFSHADDPRQPLAEALCAELGAGALLLARPVGPCGEAMRLLALEALENGPVVDGLARITPGDSETRTFLHDLPVVAGLEAGPLAEALRRRKGCLVLDGGEIHLAAAGSLSPEQPFVTASSMGFACLVGFLAALLRDLRAHSDGPVSPERLAGLARLRALLEADQARLPQAPPELMRGPFPDADTARAAMIQAGRAVVDYGLVDSSFGNLSCRQADPGGELLLISQTGSSLDELAGCIDPCRFDGGSCAGLTASSELSAHRAVYDACPARTILHGHPPFAVVLSMDCEDAQCQGRGQCHRACARERVLHDPATGLAIPIVPGEVGTGPYGLCNTLPGAMPGRAGVMVYGHGLFTVGGADFREAFATLLATERFCREECFRRVDALVASHQRS